MDRPTLAGILRTHGSTYRRSHALSPTQARAWRAIVDCRTAALGGVRGRCANCGAGGHGFGALSDPPCPPAPQVGKVRAGIYPNWDAAAYADWCRRFDLPENKKYGDYSTGMKMKQCLAVALSHHPKLLLLDEATSGLDPVVRDELIDLLLDFVRDENHAILISSHIVSDLEKLCDTIAFLHKGKLLLCEDKDTLREEYALWHGTAGQLEELDKNAIVSRRVTAYGDEALV